MVAASQVLRNSTRTLGKVLTPIPDIISPTPTYLLQTALSSHFHKEPPQNFLNPGSALPPSHHLVYFPPHVPETQLYQDGHNSEESPQLGYLRTLWVGHDIEFNTNPDNVLRIGDEAVMKEQVVAVDDGELKTSDPSTTRYIKMLFSREYFKKGRTEPAVTEIRKLAFFKKQGPALGRNEDVAVNNLVEEVDEDVEAMLTEEERVPIERRPLARRIHPVADFKIPMTPTSLLLMRFSSLTYNAHKIHYDPVFARKEGYSGCLVHGPLTTVLMMNGLKQHLGKSMQTVKMIEARNIAPLVADHEVKICGRQVTREGRNEWRLWIEGEAGQVAVRAAVTFVEGGNGRGTEEMVKKRILKEREEEAARGQATPATPTEAGAV